MPAFGETTQFEHIKKHYTKSHKQINPHVSLLVVIRYGGGGLGIMQMLMLFSFLVERHSCGPRSGYLAQRRRGSGCGCGVEVYESVKG